MKQVNQTRSTSSASTRKDCENSLLQAVTAQSIKGHSFKLEDSLLEGAALIQDLEAGPSQLKEQPYREIDGRPVYHTSVNTLAFQMNIFDVRKVHKWGQLHHPCLALSSCAIGGDVRFYVDTRVAGFYSLWTSTQIDEVWGFGSGSSRDLVAWTSKTAGDSIRRAGFRLAHAALLSTFDVSSNEWCQDLRGWEDGPWGSREVAWLLGAISPTVHKREKALEGQLTAMPEYLRPFYEKNATVGEPTEDYLGC